MKWIIFSILAILVNFKHSFAQCCAGGSGSPVAGGTSQGVLVHGQLEMSTHLQYINSNRFYSGDVNTSEKYFDRYNSLYQYFRLAYGATEKLTMSLETGNYFFKKEIGLNNDADKTYKSSGLGDLIIFPRYELLKITSPKGTTEITMGLGYKIPLGSYNDSTGRTEPFSGKTYYVTNPQAVQLTSGAQDIIFHIFLAKSYPKYDFNFYASSLYIKKGWNPLGEKSGDFASIALFVGKKFYENFNLTAQLRGEWMGKMRLNENILLYAYPNYNPEATGYRKVFLTPQIGYSRNHVTFYINADLPIYQYVTDIQVGTMLQCTMGLSYRFTPFRRSAGNVPQGVYYCPMHPKVQAQVQAKCPDCGMDLVKK